MKNDLGTIKNVHFIGIGGSGMSGLARILKAQKKTVTGSDISRNHTVEALMKEGIKVMIGHKSGNLPAKAEMVVYSPAVPRDNPEMKAARKKGKPVFSYPQAVGLLTRTRATICICGTHGKTTTTAMASAVFIGAGKDPSVIVGSVIKELHEKNARNGKGKDLIIESCEYRRGFLNYHPQTIIVTNVEADHLDYYKGLADYRKAFLEFVKKLPANGMVIANRDDKNVRIILKKYPPKKIVWFGKSSGSEYLLKQNAVYHRTRKLAELSLTVPGEHNLMNATAVIALAHRYKLPLPAVKRSLEGYKGSSRRFETVGYCGKAVVIDDYAHHPTEIRATLKAARDKYGAQAKILCVFQPHQYSRTYKLLKDFAKAFGDADEVIIPDIYGVRDTAADLKKISVAKLVSAIAKFHGRVSDGKGFDATTEKIRGNDAYDVIITMGAGNVYKIAETLVRKMNKRPH